MYFVKWPNFVCECVCLCMGMLLLKGKCIANTQQLGCKPLHLDGLRIHINKNYVYVSKCIKTNDILVLLQILELDRITRTNYVGITYKFILAFD